MTQATPTTRKQCIGTTRAGQPCAATPQSASPWCFTHDPARAAERAEARALGGHNRSDSVRLERLMPARLVSVFDLLEQVLAEVHRGETDPKVAGAMAAISRAMVSVLSAGQFEERIRMLEEGQKNV